MFDDATIVAIATANGIGSISIVRISGVNALEIATKISKKTTFQPRLATLSSLYDINNEVIDEALVLYFKAPFSFTGEDVIEFQCHGGVAIANMIVNEALKHGARIANPGEFSKRAFFNNKIDLTKAEAISKIIEARSEDAVKLLARQLKGELTNFVNEIREDLLFMLAYTEVSIDYAEDDLPTDIFEQIAKKLDTNFYLAQDGEITLVLAEGGWLRELHNYVKTNKFISERALAILDERSKSIIRSKQDDNQTRKQKLVAGFKEAIRAAQCWINGRVVNLATSDIKQIIAQICEYYIDNNYSNLQLIAKPYPDPVEVSIRNLIQHGFDDLIGAADVKSLNPKAYSEVESYLQMQKTIGQRVNLTGLINRFERKPFGWQEQQTAALLGEMYLNNGINLVYKNQIVAKENIPSKLFAKREWADIYLEVKEATPQELLNNVGKLYHELFKQIGNTLESALQSDYLKQLKHWQEQIHEWRQSASAVSFPLDNGLIVGLTTLDALGNNQDNILPRVWDKHSELKQLAKIMEQTTSSFEPQLNLWRQLSDNLTKFKSELNFFANTELLKQDFSELNNIQQNKDLAKLPQVKRLIHQLSTAYTQELINFRHKVIQQLDSGVAKISAELDLVNASADERNQVLLKLNKYTRDEINEAVNFAHLAGIERNLTLMIDEQIDDIHQQVEAKAKLASLNNSNLSTPATAQPRKIRRIMARNYVGKTYLETTADVDNYLSKLRHELIAAIAADNRVEIN